MGISVLTHLLCYSYPFRMWPVENVGKISQGFTRDRLTLLRSVETFHDGSCHLIV